MGRRKREPEGVGGMLFYFEPHVDGSVDVAEPRHQ